MLPRVHSVFSSRLRLLLRSMYQRDTKLRAFALRDSTALHRCGTTKHALDNTITALRDGKEQRVPSKSRNALLTNVIGLLKTQVMLALLTFQLQRHTEIKSQTDYSASPTTTVSNASLASGWLVVGSRRRRMLVCVSKCMGAQALGCERL